MRTPSPLLFLPSSSDLSKKFKNFQKNHLFFQANCSKNSIVESFYTLVAAPKRPKLYNWPMLCCCMLWRISLAEAALLVRNPVHLVVFCPLRNCLRRWSRLPSPLWSDQINPLWTFISCWCLRPFSEWTGIIVLSMSLWSRRKRIWVEGFHHLLALLSLEMCLNGP